MTPTQVGMRCPECARQRTPVRTLRSIRPQGPLVTYVLIAINVLVFFADGHSITAAGGGGSGNSIWTHSVLFGPSIKVNHEYWRLLTSGFLHENLLHILFNMYFLFVIGSMLEPAIGRTRFATVYFVALLAGSLGALIATVDTPTVGASGACFGIMGATAVELRNRGIGLFESQIGGLIVINLILSFTISGISVGGHIGGLIGGALAMGAFHEGDRRRMPALGLIAGVILACIAVGGGIVAAQHALSLPPGFTL